MANVMPTCHGVHVVIFETDGATHFAKMYVN